MAADGRSRAGTAFLALWIVVWTAALIVAVGLFARALTAGTLAPAVILILWIAGAAFALSQAIIRLVRQVRGDARQPPHSSHRPRGWHDGIGEGDER